MKQIESDLHVVANEIIMKAVAKELEKEDKPLWELLNAKKNRDCNPDDEKQPVTKP